MRWIAAICLVALVALCVAVLRVPPPRLLVSNESSVALADVRIHVGERKAHISGLASGSVEGRALLGRREGPLRVELVFADGTRRTLAVGWVSPGMDGDAHLVVVSPDSVRFELRQPSSRRGTRAATRPRPQDRANSSSSTPGAPR